MSNLCLSAYIADLAIEELEVTAINNEIIQQQETISDALATSVYVDNIQNVVTETYIAKIELSRSTMQCINLAIENICQNLGADPVKYINTLSVESYTSDTYKSIALEDMSVFIKELWVKIKVSIDNLWEKVSEFWNNNFSSLMKIQKVLETTLRDVNEKYKQIGSSLTDSEDKHILNSFNNGKDVDAKTIESFISTHYHGFNTIDELVKHTKHFNHFVRNLNQTDFESEVDYILENLTKNFLGKTFKLGTDNIPLINGDYITIEYVRAENDKDLTLLYDIQKKYSDETKRIYLIDKTNLKTILMKTLDIIKHTTKYKQIQDSLQKDLKTLISTYDKYIEQNGLVIDFDDMQKNKTQLSQNYKKTIRMIYRVNSSLPKIFGAIIVGNVKLARSVVTYSHFCLSHPT